MADEVVCRPAELADKEAVIGIHDDVFEGFDYLPSMFTSFMHNKDVYCNLAEVNGKVISFNFHYIAQKGTHVTEGGMRTAVAFQGKGVSTKLSVFAKRRTMQMFPQMQVLTWVSINESTVEKIRSGLKKDSRIAMIMNLIHYRTTNEVLCALSAAFPKPDHDTLITLEAGNYFLSAPNRMSLFPENVLKYYSPWLLFKPTDETLKVATRLSRVIVTKKKKDGEVLSVSFGSLIPTPKVLFRYDIDLYIDPEIPVSVLNQVIISHSVEHMKVAAALSKPGDKIGIFMCFPQHSEIEVVENALRPHLGDKVQSAFFSGVFAFVFESELSVQSMP